MAQTSQKTTFDDALCQNVLPNFNPGGSPSTSLSVLQPSAPVFAGSAESDCRFRRSLEVVRQADDEEDYARPSTPDRRSRFKGLRNRNVFALGSPEIPAHTRQGLSSLVVYLLLMILLQSRMIRGPLCCCDLSYRGIGRA
jgi:hypothetical protein